MVSACYNRWVKVQNSAGKQKWRNEGPAPDGACPSCPNKVYPAEGTWDGASAACSDGNIIKMVADGNGGKKPGDVIVPVGSPKATQACNGNYFYWGIGPIQQYF